MAAAEFSDLFQTIVPRNTIKKVHHCNGINKLTNTLSEYQKAQRVDTQNVQAQRVTMAPIDLHMPTSHKAIRTAPRIYREMSRCNTPLKEIEQEVQTEHDQATRDVRGPEEQVQMVNVGDPGTNKNMSTGTLCVQMTVPRIPMIKMKRMKRKKQRDLKEIKSVDEQLTIDN